MPQSTRSRDDLARIAGGDDAVVLSLEREDRRGAGRTLEPVLAAVLQRQARAVEQVARSARDEDLAWTGERGKPRRNSAHSASSSVGRTWLLLVALRWALETIRIQQVAVRIRHVAL